MSTARPDSRPSRTRSRPRSRISLEGVTEVALALADREGLEAVSLTAVAEALGVGPSALYTHVDGLEGLRYTVAVAATHGLTETVRDAAVGVAGDEAVYSLGTAYRGFAHEHPGQYASTLLPPRSSDDELARASRGLLDVIARVFRLSGLDEEASRSAATATRSALHGFLALEFAAGPGRDHDRHFRDLLTVLVRGIAA